MHKGSKTAGGKQRWICRDESGGGDKYCYSTTNPDSATVRRQDHTTEDLPDVFPWPGGEKTTFLITYAQNATAVHSKFWAALTAYAEHLDAHIIVQPGRYRVSLVGTNSEKEDRNDIWWDERVVPHLCNERVTLNKNLEFLGDIPIIATAASPLTGLEDFGARSKIVGHSRLQFKTVATPSHKMAAMLTTTGACTRKHYTDTRLGKKGEFHHTLGAVLVEIEGPLFWLTHITAHDNGSFTDRGVKVTAEGVQKKRVRAAAAVFGDTHVRVHDPVVDVATFGPKGIVETYRPQALVFHDLEDGQTHNHHDAKDPFVQHALAVGGKANVQAEVSEAIAFVRHRTPPWAKSFVVASNHHDFLSRWIIEGDWKKLPAENRQFYLENALMMVKSAMLVDGMAEYASPFAHHVNTKGGRGVRALGLGESLMIEGIQCGFHGHKGPNGSRGSIKNMRAIGEKTIIGHSHSPGIEGGAYQVGHSAKANQPYTRGSPSSWMHTHCLIWPGGKRQLITIVNGRHRR